MNNWKLQRASTRAHWHNCSTAAVPCSGGTRSVLLFKSTVSYLNGDVVIGKDWKMRYRVRTMNYTIHQLAILKPCVAVIVSTHDAGIRLRKVVVAGSGLSKGVNVGDEVGFLLKNQRHSERGCCCSSQRVAANLSWSW